MGKRLEYILNQRGDMDGKRQMKRCSTLLVIKEMQIKITIRYHNTPIRMVNVKKTDQGTSSGWDSSGSDSTLPMPGGPRFNLWSGS